MALGGGYFKTTYASDLALVDTRLRRTALALMILALLVLPRLVSPFVLDLVAQTALAAVGTLALHHVVLYACGEFQNHWGANTGVSIPPPRFGAWVLKGTTAWYYALTAVAGLILILSVNLQRSRAGRAWMAIRDREIAAESV